MRRMVFVLGVALMTARAAAAQPPVVIARDGWEAFPNVEYQGGDATHTKKRWGMLVLTDSTLSFHECAQIDCPDFKKVLPYKSSAISSIRLATIKEVNSTSRVRGASVSSKIAFGGLASDRAEEFVGLVYETSSSAEAPMFKTMRAQSAAIEAKLRFRMKKLGFTLPEGGGER